MSEIEAHHLVVVGFAGRCLCMPNGNHTGGFNAGDVATPIDKFHEIASLTGAVAWRGGGRAARKGNASVAEEHFWSAQPRSD